MTSQGNGPPPRYAVRMSGLTRSILKQLHLQTRIAGRSKRFLAAVRKIVTKLAQEPLTFGEPLYRLPALRLTVYQAVVDIVLITPSTANNRWSSFAASRSFRKGPARFRS
jgi:hypothetical protein